MRRRQAILSIPLAGLLAGAAAPGAAPPSSGPGPVVGGTQCRVLETVLYSCRFGRKTGSVCLGARAVHYRFGPAGEPEIDVSSDREWSNVHSGGVIGGGSGGYQNHVRFTSAGHDYVVFEARAGEYTDVAGKRWSGIRVFTGEREVASLDCRGKASVRPGWQSLLAERAPAAAALADEDPRFDLWF